MTSTESSERAISDTQAAGRPPGKMGCQSPTWNKPVPPFGAFEFTMTSEDDLKGPCLAQPPFAKLEPTGLEHSSMSWQSPIGARLIGPLGPGLVTSPCFGFPPLIRRGPNAGSSMDRTHRNGRR